MMRTAAFKVIYVWRNPHPLVIPAIFTSTVNFDLTVCEFFAVNLPTILYSALKNLTSETSFHVFLHNLYTSHFNQFLRIAVL